MSIKQTWKALLAGVGTHLHHSYEGHRCTGAEQRVHLNLHLEREADRIVSMDMTPAEAVQLAEWLVREAQEAQIKNATGGLQIEPIGRPGLVELVAARESARETQGRLDDLLEDLMTNIPECWDDDLAPESIVSGWVHTLENYVRAFPGMGRLHKIECACVDKEN